MRSILILTTAPYDLDLPHRMDMFSVGWLAIGGGQMADLSALSSKNTTRLDSGSSFCCAF
jgi:hypothetical protein